MSVGFAPAHALLYQAGATMRYEPSLEQLVPDTLPAGVFGCGKVNGHYGFEARIADGECAGAAAAVSLGLESTAPAPPVGPVECPTHCYPIFSHPRGKEFVDFDEDLHISDFENAAQEGFDSPELLKRYSTVGMGPSQGKHSNMNALRILAKLKDSNISAYAPTTARPMYHPVPLSHLAGRGFTPERRTPVDAQHAELGAVWMTAGQWRRPEYYARPRLDRAAAIAEEVAAVRNRVGLIDVGTLGKIEAHGPLAGEFLERVYTGRFADLKVGMTRYGLMLDESGVIVDDGVIARVESERFYFTTTTANSGTLFREFGRLATAWELPVGLVNLTGHFAAFNLTGPAARALLRSLTSLDLSHAAFPYLGVREGQVAGIPCRLLRVGFVGEIGYEIHLPLDRATDLWRALLAAGAAYGIRSFGVEAQRQLRLEKGHIIVGQDTDGLTSPLEIGAGWAVKRDKPFFIGQRSLDILRQQPLRRQLVGFRLSLGEMRRPKECHLVIDHGALAGRVTSVAFSPIVGRTIGLAFVTPTVAARGRLQIRIERNAELTAEIVPLPFYDPAGARQRLEDPA
jgi:sarcosine oxidase subunit alpha